MNKTIQNSLERMVASKEGSLTYCMITSAAMHENLDAHISFYVDKVGEVLYAGFSNPQAQTSSEFSEGTFRVNRDKNNKPKITGYSVQNPTKIVRKNLDGFVEEFNKYYDEKFNKKR